MNIALIRVPLSFSEIEQLTHEFPQFLFLAYPETQLKKISPEHWAKIEILFGNKLNAEELLYAESLKWIHSPSSRLTSLPLDEIESKGNILITYTLEENALQIAEFVMGAFLSFTKLFFQWQEAMHFPALIWDAKWRERMGTLQGKTLLQVGMEKPGQKIAQKAHENGMKVISIDKLGSFHPYCKECRPLKDLHEVLPKADYVSVYLPMTREYKSWFGLNELKLMKEGSVLSFIAPTPLLNREAEEALPYFERLKGAIIDASYFTPLSPNSPLWKVPNLLITPGISGRPKSEGKEAFKLFRANLRDYLHENFIDMRYQFDSSILQNASREL